MNEAKYFSQGWTSSVDQKGKTQTLENISAIRPVQSDLDSLKYHEIFKSNINNQFE